MKQGKINKYKYQQWLLAALFVWLGAGTAVAQKPLKKVASPMKTVAVDSLRHYMDTLRADEAGRHDTLPISPDAITDIIHYTARDSIALQLDDRQAFLYNDGNIEYQQIVLKADSIAVNFETRMIVADGMTDTNGKVHGYPYFKQDGTEYQAEKIRFNYDTKRGLISSVITQEGDGFLHGSQVKKVNDSVMYLKSGQYTTCNYDHPHFAINFSKSKLITGDKIITGPAYLSIEDVPTPIALPFAFFPLSHDRSSGIIVPSYGWMNNRGYYLSNGGYYLPLGDYMDLTLLGDIYTNLSWAAEGKLQYYRKYRYKGHFEARYGITKEGIRGDTNSFSKFSDYKIVWRHDQDPKANPNSRFSADVQLQSRNYSKNTTNRNDYFNSTTTSSISYTASIGSIFNLAASARESFNAQTGIMDLKLPSVSLSTRTIYPFRSRNTTGSYKWYENISMTYTLNGESNVSDSNLFKQNFLRKMNYGIQQNIPLSSSIKVFRFFNWTNSASYSERWHWSTIQKTIDPSTNELMIDTIQGFSANHDVNLSSSLSTRIYGMFNFKYGLVKALRHVINPSVSFNYHPDMGVNCWKEYTDTTGYTHRYSIYEHSLYGGPADGKSGRLTFSVGNNLEIKVKSLKDTIEELKKVTLLENLNLAMSYDLAKDSLQWSDLSVTGRTTLMKNLVLNYSGSFCPYVIDTLGRKFNQTLWQTEHRLFRKSNATWSAQLSFSLNNNTFNKNRKQSDGTAHAQTLPPIMQTPYNLGTQIMTGSFVDFSVPWNLSVSYSLSHVTTYLAREMGYDTNIVQALSLSGNISLTPNWKIAVTTGYDFVNKGMSYTSIDIYRDLHCWEMRFNWIPFGYYKSWNFMINIKAPSLKDVKYEKKKSYMDNQGYQSY